jgi:hypothetical protein
MVESKGAAIMKMQSISKARDLRKRGIQRKHDELLVRISLHAEEMRMHKNQQWRIIYYYVLLLAALVIAFQQQIPLFQYYLIVKCVALVIVPVLAIATIIHLLALKYEIDFNRAAGESMERQLDSITGLSSLLVSMHNRKYNKIIQKTNVAIRWLPRILKERELQMTFFNVTFYALFVSIVVLAGLAAFVMILFDK